MRTSRTVPEIDKVQKVVYPKCNIKKQHEKQSLNLVCITKTCKMLGPICALCKKDHAGHNIVPIKTFLTTISESHRKISTNNSKIQQKQQMKQKIPTKSILQKIQDQFNQTMSMLNYQVKQLSQQIRRTEQKLIQQYQLTKNLLSQQCKKQQIIEQSLNYLNNQSKNVLEKDVFQYRKYISKLLKLTTLNNKNEIKFEDNEEKIFKTYQNKCQIVKDNLFIIGSQIKDFYTFVTDKLMNDFVEKVGSDITRPKTAMPGSLKVENITFSPTLKAPNIILEKDNKMAKLKDNIGNKIVFLNNVISLKTYQTTIKIINLADKISVGVGLKDKSKLKGYKFQKSLTGGGHGMYMIVSNTFKHNSTQKTQDGTSNSFAFGNEDEINICLKIKQKKLIFTVKNDTKKITQLNLKGLPDSSFKQLQFCACLSTMGDKIEVL